MNKNFFNMMLFLLCSFSCILMGGCSRAGDKDVSFTVLYAITAVFSFLLLIFLLFHMRVKDRWLIFLFFCVFTVNAGYFMLSSSSSLEGALWANRLAYLGSVFLPLSMLMIILNATRIKYPRQTAPLLFWLGTAVFLLAASPGILNVYYKDVSLTVINGASVLVKEYGPLHHVYMIYLIGYFSAMTAILLYSRKKPSETKITDIMLLISVFVNICVWLAEQFVSISFEFLSISYVISELFLMGVHVMSRENERLKELAKTAEVLGSFSPTEAAAVLETAPAKTSISNTDDTIYTCFVKGIELLTPTEKLIYEAYTARATTPEILASLHITQNTLKYHSKNIYSKLGVHSRKELMDIYKQLLACQKNTTV